MSGLGRKKLRKISERDRDIIDHFMPWLPSEYDPSEGNLTLFQLHDADRVRKHRDLLKWACLGGAFPSGEGYVRSFISDGVVFSDVGKIERLASFHEITTQVGVQINLVYNEPPTLRHHDVSEMLLSFNDVVSEILSAFA